MPWCAACDRFLSPSTVLADGTCPVCGRHVDPGGAGPRTEGPRTADGTAGEDLPPIPWHLKLLAGGVVLYLGVRFVQMFDWVWDRF